jgi:hypothetical protein
LSSVAAGNQVLLLTPVFVSLLARALESGQLAGYAGDVWLP